MAWQDMTYQLKKMVCLLVSKEVWQLETNTFLENARMTDKIDTTKVKYSNVSTKISHSSRTK